MTNDFEYYVVAVGSNTFDLRQTRYAAQLARGVEHPNDLMAAHFSAQGMRELIAKYFQNTDASVLESAGV